MFLSLTTEEIKDEQQNILKSLQLNPPEIIALERLTINQSVSDVWKQEHRFRLTASNFRRICALRSTTSRTNTLKYILYNEDLVGTTPGMK